MAAHLHKWRTRHSLLLGYLILAAAAIVALSWSSRNQDRIEYEAQRLSYANCVAINDLRHDIVDYLNTRGSDSDIPPIPDDIDQSLQEWLEAVVNRSSSEHITDAQVSFADLDCPPDPSEVLTE